MYFSQSIKSSYVFFNTISTVLKKAPYVILFYYFYLQAIKKAKLGTDSNYCSLYQINVVTEVSQWFSTKIVLLT